MHSKGKGSVGRPRLSLPSSPYSYFGGQGSSESYKLCFEAKNTHGLKPDQLKQVNDKFSGRAGERLARRRQCQFCSPLYRRDKPANRGAWERIRWQD